MNNPFPIKEGKVGETYLLDDDYKSLTIADITTIDGATLSVSVIFSDGSSTRISGDTQVINYNPQLERNPGMKKTKAEKATEQAKAPKQEKPKAVPMSLIIEPMLLSGKYTAEEVVDAVIEKHPDRKSDRDMLIKQVAGPRLNNLKKKAKEEGLEMPSLKPMAKPTPAPKPTSKKKSTKAE
jgi:hypothetical protein